MTGIDVAGLYTEGLIAGKGLSVGGLYVEVLCSQVSLQGIRVGGFVQETLCLYLPQYPSYGPIPVFPPLPVGFPVKLSPVLDTILGTTKSLRELRSSQQSHPIWDIELLFEELRDQTQNQEPYGLLVGFTQFMQAVENWLMMYGQANVFALDCPWDDSRANQNVGTGDGETFVFTLYYSFGANGVVTELPVGMINTISAVYFNGTLVPSSGYVVGRNTLTFLYPDGVQKPPAAGVGITATFSFYYLCRYVADEQDYVEFSKNRWQVDNLKLRASPWLT